LDLKDILAALTGVKNDTILDNAKIKYWRKLIKRPQLDISCGW